MKIKKEYLILAALIVVLSLYIVLHKQDRTTYQLPKIAAVEGGDINKIEIIGNQGTIELGKEASDWKLLPESYPADAAKIKDMLNVISELTLTALVSEAENYQLYDLDEAHRIRVKAWSKGSIVREFDAGKAASSFQHTYIKLPGDSKVYHARGNFRRKFDLSIDELRDKEVLSFEAATVYEIAIERGERASTFSKKQTEGQGDGKEQPEASEAPVASSPLHWVNEKNEKADEEAIQRWLTTLTDLKCDKYMEEDLREAIKEPIYRVVLKGEKEHILSIFDLREGDDSQYPAASSDNPYTFFLSKWRVENIMKDPAELMKKKDTN